MFRHRSSSSSSSILLQRFEQLFRCPVCYGGQQVQLPPMSTSTATKITKSTSSKNSTCWMTGHELDYHIGHDMRTHRSMRTKSLQERISKMRSLSLSFQKEENSDDQQKYMSNNNNNNHLTRRKFQSELNSLLSALPNTTLVDRYLIVDSANAQHQTNVGTLSSLPEMQKLWQAFQKERICVIFIQENLFENQAPIFNALGAMAEGSANMHDGGKEYHQKYLLSSSSSSEDKRKEEKEEEVLPLWRRRGADFRLLSRNSCQDSKNGDDDATNLPSKNYDVHSLSKNSQQEHPLRPWNSVVIPTVRGFESGDFAAFECLQTLHKIMLEDEAAEIDALMNLFSSSSSSKNDDDAGSEMFPTRKSRGRLSAARIDLVTDDRELIEAAEGGFLSGGRVSQFPHVSKFASGVLNG